MARLLPVFPVPHPRGPTWASLLPHSCGNARWRSMRRPHFLWQCTVWQPGPRSCPAAAATHAGARCAGPFLLLLFQQWIAWGTPAEPSPAAPSSRRSSSKLLAHPRAARRHGPVIAGASRGRPLPALRAPSTASQLGSTRVLPTSSAQPESRRPAAPTHALDHASLFFWAHWWPVVLPSPCSPFLSQ